MSYENLFMWDKLEKGNRNYLHIMKIINIYRLYFSSFQGDHNKFHYNQNRNYYNINSIKRDFKFKIHKINIILKKFFFHLI